MTFKLKSGNKISFKDMGSSPAKQKVDPDAPGTPGKIGNQLIQVRIIVRRRLKK